MHGCCFHTAEVLLTHLPIIEQSVFKVVRYCCPGKISKVLTADIYAQAVAKVGTFLNTSAK